MKVNDFLISKYRVETEKIPSRPGCWDVLNVKIFESFPESPDKPSQQIGEYPRNYSSLMNTFHPFVYKGKHYALYSKDYTATRIMSLPDCKDIGGEERQSYGFCPVEYAYPLITPEDYCIEVDGKIEEARTNYDTFPYAFMSGCVWGDDSSWKVQLINLSKLDEGIITREDWMGYIELPRDIDLKDAINFWLWEPDNWRVQIATPKTFDLDRKVCLDTET